MLPMSESPTPPPEDVATTRGYSEPPSWHLKQLGSCSSDDLGGSLSATHATESCETPDAIGPVVAKTRAGLSLRVLPNT